MYTERNIDARSFNLGCSGVTLSITQCERVLLALFTQHAKRVLRNTRIVFVPVWPYHNFPHYLMNGKSLRSKL
jgi:DNA-binding response OmpR family regulator